MRISDWSSDVCSSDLDFLPGDVRLESGRRHHAREDVDQAALANAGIAEYHSHLARCQDQVAYLESDQRPGQSNPPDMQDARRAAGDGYRGKGRAIRFQRHVALRSDASTSELQQLMRNSYAVFGVKNNNTT